MSEIDVIKRALDRERRARKEAEQILEDKSRQLYESNEKLRRLNLSLERKVASRTEEISRNSRQLEALFENNPIPIIVYDTKHLELLAVNQTALENYGLSESEFSSIGISELLIEDQRNAFNEKLLETNDLANIEGQWQHRTKYGHVIHVDISTTDLEFDGRPAIMVLINDITEQKSVEEQLRIAKNEAESSARSKEIFMANMSHEIRTPMNAIIGMGEILFRSDLTAKQREHLSAIRTSADNLLVIINDILDFSKIEAGRMELSSTSVDIPGLIRDCVRTIELKAEQKGIILRTEIDPEVAWYSVDPTRLGQVMINLLSNAVKFTDSGEVHITCRKRLMIGSSDQLYFSVKDTGIGVDPSKLEKIFESFMQADESTARTYGGTGLGLPISKELVGMMGGELQIQSALGVGTTFSFELFLEKCTPVIELEIPDSVSEEVLKGCTILLVEDNDINRFMAQTILENWSCDIAFAMNGQEAIESISAKDFDLVLMDMSMPVMNGIDATLYVRQELKSNVPIIGLTANALKGDREKCIAAGMNDYVSKPFVQEELKRKMISLISAESHDPLARSISSKNLEDTGLVDLTLLERSTNGDREFMQKMILLFLEEADSRINAFHTAIQDKDLKSVRTTAHSMKPSIDHLAHEQLRSLVRIIEQQESDDESVLNETKRFVQLLQALKIELLELS